MSVTVMTDPGAIDHWWHSGAVSGVSQAVECLVSGCAPLSCNLDKLFTSMCIHYQAVKFVGE